MEAELEGMIVDGWVQGDRAKLLLRAEALERELSLMEAGRQLERETFASQKKSLSQRMVETDEEHRNVVKELSLRVKAEENLRRVCQRRLQELEAQALLLGEQLGAAEAKFRETEKALCRERTNNARRRFECLNHCCKERAEGRKSTSKSADDRCASDRDRNVAFDDASRNPAFRLARHANGGHRRGGPGYEGDDGGARARTAEAGELRVVERLVAGLLTENLRLGSTLKQLQEGPGKSSPANSSVSAFLLDAVGNERRESKNNADRGAEEARTQPLTVPPPPAVGFALVDNSDFSTGKGLGMVPPELDRDPKVVAGSEDERRKDDGGRGEKNRRQISDQKGASTSIRSKATGALVPQSQSANQGQDARIKDAVFKPPGGGEAFARHGRGEIEGLKGDGGRERHSSGSVEISEGLVVKEGKVDIAAGLSKIQALTGMVRVQEEIEALLAQELRWLKKEAADCVRLWRVVIRWEKVLCAKGYNAQHDIRAAGLRGRLRQRLAAEVRGT